MDESNNVYVGMRYGTDIAIIREDGSALENSTIFTMTAEDKVTSEVSIGYNTAKEESDISNIQITFESVIIPSINKPGMMYKLDPETNGIIIRLVNMTPECFTNLRGDQDIHIFTSKKTIGTYDIAEITVELIVQLVRDSNNTLVVTLNIYSKLSPYN